MNVLWLGSHDKLIEGYLVAQGDDVVFTEDEITVNSYLLIKRDFIVSFGYRHIVPVDILEKFFMHAINIHISYLPWNRGADPNLWSFLEDTPKGVSIHLMTDKLDAGDLLCQDEVIFSMNETLRSSYEALMQTARNLFVRHWPQIKLFNIKPCPQISGGSYHRRSDRDAYAGLLLEGWETPAELLIGKALRKNK